VSLRERLAQRRRMGSLGLSDEYDFDANRTVDDYLAPGLAPTAAPAAPDMAFDISETEPNDAYQTALAASRQELSAPIAAPGLAPPPPNVPAPAVAGAPVSPPPVQAPTGAGALPTAAAPLVVPPNPAAPPQGIPAIQAQANQRQQPMQAPPQPPQPVTPAPAPTEVASANEVFAGAPVSAPGLAAPQAPPQAKDTARSDKMLGRTAPGLQGYAMAPEERAALDDARQGDRRMRIAQGVLGGLGGVLGMVGLGTGNRALAGVGAGVSQVGRVIPQGRRAAEVLADYDRRRESLGQQQTAESRAQQLGIEGERVGVQQLGAQANMVRAQGQAQLDQANAANAEFERSAAEGNAAGMRNAIRAYIAGMPDNDPRKRIFAERYGEGSDLDLMQGSDELGEVMGLVRSSYSPGERIASTYSGGRTEEVTVRKPDGSYETIRRRVGGNRGPSGPTFSDPFAPVADVATAPAPMDATQTPAPAPAPVRGGGRRGDRRPRPAPVAGGPAPAETTPEGVPIDTSVGASLNRYRQAIEAAGGDLNDPLIVAELEEYSRNRSAGTDAAQARASADLNRRLAEANQARSSGLPAGVSAAQWAAARAPTFTEHVGMWGDAREAVTRLRDYRTQNQQGYRRALVLAGQNSPLTGVDPEIAEMARDMTANLIPVLSRLAGANVTDQELNRVQQAMGLGSIAAAVSNPQGLENNLTNGLASIQRRTRAQIAGGMGPRAAAHVFHNSLGRSVAYWERVFGGGE
jgi:hypothetical protein